MTTTLSDLLQPRTRDDLTALLLGTMQNPPAGAKLPTTDWYPGSIDDTIVKMMVTGLLDREDLIPFLAGANFLDYASSMVDADGNLIEGWMELLAWNGYGKERVGATFTQQRLTLTCSIGPGPYTRSAGELIAYAPATGNRYINIASVTIPDGGSVVAVFQAESAGLGYTDQVGTIVALTTPLPGVTVSNLPSAASAALSTITGSGTIAVSSTAITSTPRTIVLIITSTGRISDGSAYASLKIYSGTGVTTVPPFALGASVSQSDLTLAITDGPSDTNSFIAGDTWTVSVPGTPFVQLGADKESLTALAERCRDVFPSRSTIATPGRYAAWAREANAVASPPLGITKVMTHPSTIVAGQETIYIAGPSSTATVEQVAAVQAYINPRIADIEVAVVAAAAACPVSLGGNVTTRRGTTTAVKAAADLAWARYLAELQIGGELPGNIVKLARLEEILMDVHAYDVFSLTLNGSATNLTLTATQCAVPATDGTGTPSGGLTWMEIA
jgi:hypothetical protein